MLFYADKFQYFFRVLGTSNINDGSREARIEKNIAMQKITIVDFRFIF